MIYCRCDCAQKLQHKFDYLKTILNDTASFKSIYRYAFDFARVRTIIEIRHSETADSIQSLSRHECVYFCFQFSTVIVRIKIREVWI